MSQSAVSGYKFDHFYLEVTKRLLWRDGEVVSLQARDFDLLLALVARQQQVILFLYLTQICYSFCWVIFKELAIRCP